MSNPAITASSPERHYFPWYQGWTVLAASMALQGFAFGLFTFSFTFWVTPWSTEFNASRAEILVIAMMGNMCMALLSPFAGRALDRFSIRKIVAAGVVVFALGLFLISLATAVWQIAVIYALVLSVGGLLSGPLAGQCLAVRWFIARRGLALGLVSIGSSIGGFLLPPLVTLLLVELGWRLTHVVFAAVALILMLPIAISFIRTPLQTATPSAADAPAAGARATGAGEWTPGKVLRSSRYWKITVGLLPLVMSIVIFSANLGPYTHDLGISPTRASVLMSVFALCMIAGKILVGYLSDLMDHRHLYALIIAVTVAAFAIMLMDPGYIEILVCSAMIGISSGSFMSLMGAVVGSQFGPTAYGMVAGMVHFCYSSMAVVVPISGWMRDHFGTYDSVWWLMLGAIALCAPFMFRLAPNRDGA